MRDGRQRTLALAVFLLLTVLLSTGAWGALEPVWSTYHFDSFRKGQNAASTDITNPASLNLIWVFPRGVSGNVDEELTTVDDLNTSYFIPQGAWGVGSDSGVGSLFSSDCWEKHFIWSAAACRDDVDQNGNPNYLGKLAKATWRLPAELGKGRFQIMVWVPALYKGDVGPEGQRLHVNTTQAEYTVYDDTGKTTVKFDQSDGGEWKLLSTRQFSFMGLGNYRIELTNLTDDPVATSQIPGELTTTVVADAIKFVPTTGQEIYSSATSAMIPWSVDWTYTDPKGVEASMSGTWSGDVPAVYVGTVESPLASGSNSPDSGAVYCINSITPGNKAIDDDNLQLTDIGRWKEINALSKYLGSTLWRYPRSAEQRADAATGNELEGPIEGGIYSTPTIAPVNDANHPLITYVAAMDRQVYALDSQTGQLLWKGPGVTKSEGKPSGWTASNPAEVFGGIYHFVPGVATNSAVTSPVIWNFDLAARQLGGEPSEGWSYAVYAWIPARTSDEGSLLRAQDATYTITYDDGSTATAATQVKVNQALLDNQGKWVKIGSSFFNVQSVRLDNTVGVLASGKTPSNYCVTADAVMIVPETIDAFGYCSPVVNVEEFYTGTVKNNATQVYCTTASGRAIAFQTWASSLTEPIGMVKWIYPKVRNVRNITGEADMDRPSMGQMGASPAYSDDKLYLAGLDGKIRCISGLQSASSISPPAEDWVESINEDEEDTVGFTSSPAIDKGYNQLFIGSTGGTFYCLDTGSGKPRWKYPEKGVTSTTALPLGAFRYSTPAIGDVAGMHRVWVGSNDGRIYSFDAATSSLERRLWVEFDNEGNQVAVHGTWYVEPSLLAPVMGSIALDGTRSGSKDLVMYVGDMREKGMMHWRNAQTGVSDWQFDPNNPTSVTGSNYQAWQTEGSLMSSPNLTNFDLSGSTESYLYCGCGDGRVYAWARHGGAWGGRWAGGDWPFPGNPNDRSQAVTTIAPDADIQFDIFPTNFSTNSEKRVSIAEETKADDTGTMREVIMGGTATEWPDDWIVSANMKKPTTSLVGSTKAVIDAELTKLAKERRNFVFPSKSDRIGSATKSNIYFEWGEKINIIFWNLPGLEYLYGSTDSSKRANIRFTFSNASAGSSAATMPITGSVKLLREYKVLDKVAQSGKDAGGTAFTYYDALKYPDDTDVKRCYALAQIEIKSTDTSPRSPGPGWVLSAELKKKTTSASDSPITPVILPLAMLKAGDSSSGNAPVPVLTPIVSGGTGVNVKEQPLGINNPLAISDGKIKIAWSPGVADRTDIQAHFNGNGIYDAVSGEYSEDYINNPPTVDMEAVSHGSSSPELTIGVMDRSAAGISVYSGSNPAKQVSIERFRVSADDLRWLGGSNSVWGPMFPWEMGIGSADYPNIYKRNQRYRKHSDDGDPSRAATVLPPLIPKAGATLVNNTFDCTFDETRPRADFVNISVDVPRFQPSNGTPSNRNTGYRRTMEAYVDSNGNGSFDSGNVVYGRQTGIQEAYRRFRVRLAVPPDPRIEVEEQLIDVGQEPHGLGVAVDFMPANPSSEVRQYFKRVTVKNSGNVNLYNLRMGRTDPLYMIRDPKIMYGMGGLADVVTIPGTAICSSLDALLPMDPILQAMKGDPFVYATGDPTKYGYTLTKPRVGDPDPTVLSIPDKRKWVANYGGVQNQAQMTAAAAGFSPAQIAAMPFPVEVGISVPVSQPVGTYQIPAVPVYADMKVDGVSVAPVAVPTFAMKVTVRESQMTGDRPPASLGGIDDGPLPKFGDATPAAFRDPVSGNVYLFWSSNRPYDPNLRPDWSDPAVPAARFTEFAGAPWFIDRAQLTWNPTAQRWDTYDFGGGLYRWWKTWERADNPFLPNFSPTEQWPSPLLGQGAQGASVVRWKYDSKETDLQSVRHTSPTVAENADVAPTADAGRNWLGWVGSADILQADGSASREYRLFYTDCTGGDVGDLSIPILSVQHDPATEKRAPSFAVYNTNAGPRMWAFWQGGDNGRWSIYYSLNDTAGFPSANWSRDQRLRTPDCLSSVSSPNAVHRNFWVNLTSGTPDTSGARHILDMVYSGVSKLQQSSDVLLSRYAAVGPADPYAAVQPGSKALPLPRVFNEKLQRDPKYGFFTSEHLAWVRLDPKRVASGTPVPNQDNWGGYDQSSAVAILNADLPYIHVVFPNGYTTPGGVTLNPGTVLSATDCSVDGAGPVPLNIDSSAPSTEFRLSVDQATGIYSYKFPDGSLAKDVLGEMLIDFSSGSVRFTHALKEITAADGTVTAPAVYADYTPMTWRLTTDAAMDDSPRSFVERSMIDVAAYPRAYPGFYPIRTSTGTAIPASVDRLWVLWRKAPAGVKSSTVYWKTYRVGIDLAKAGYAPIPMNPDGTVAASAALSVTGALGPYEVDRTGTRIYFTEVDERYRSIARPDTPSYLTAPSSPPATVLSGSQWQPITVSYTLSSSGGTNKTVNATLWDAYWLNEMPEQSLFGFVGSSSVNEGSVYGFADLGDPGPSGGFTAFPYSKIWVLWTSTRAGTSDLCWATISPNFTAR